MPALEALAAIAPVVAIGIKHLRSVVDLVAGLVSQGPTQPELAELLRKEAERLLVLAGRVDAAQAEDQKRLDARIPPKP